jgi:glutamate/tyrosine decarboxylase-like PLP-dependent enzyme
MSSKPDVTRRAPLEMSPEEFRAAGHDLVDRIAAFLDTLRDRPVTPAEPPGELRALLGDDALPLEGRPAGPLVARAAELVIDHSLYNGHPKFWGYITSSAAPIGALADLLAASVNPNCGAESLAPVATQIEAQTVRWIADMIGFPRSCGGLLVSGGNMANFVGFLAARKAKAPWDVRTRGASGGGRLAVYASQETHTWIQKATDLFGLGTEALRWIPTGADLAMDVGALEAAVEADRRAGVLPAIVVGTAGSVSTGAIDPLPEIAALCRKHDMWFHVDGAYGAPAAMLPEAPERLKALHLADSVALDPHKWLYAPLEAGCALVRDPSHLRDAFAYHPPYYAMERPDDEPPLNYHEWGLQNSRGFRALKVWLGILQSGRDGYVAAIRDDIALARALDAAVAAHPELESGPGGLSIATFRFVPEDLAGRADAAAYLDELNREILTRLQTGGEAFVSNAVVGGRYLLRACIVNFRTQASDVAALPEIVARAGRAADAALRPASLQ